MRSLRRAVLRRRRILAAALTAVAVASGLGVVRPTPPATVTVLVAAHDLPVGTTVTADDLTTVGFAASTVPAGVIDPVGKVLAAPVRAGEPIVDVRVLDSALTSDLDDQGLAVTPVRLPDAEVVGLLTPGLRIDLIGTDPTTGEADLLASDVLVLGVPAADTDAASGGAAAAMPSGGRLVILGLAREQAVTVSTSAVRLYLTVTISG